MLLGCSTVYLITRQRENAADCVCTGVGKLGRGPTSESAWVEVDILIMFQL